MKNNPVTCFIDFINKNTEATHNYIKRKTNVVYSFVLSISSSKVLMEVLVV